MWKLSNHGANNSSVPFPKRMLIDKQEVRILNFFHVITMLGELSTYIATLHLGKFAIKLL